MNHPSTAEKRTASRMSGVASAVRTVTGDVARGIFEVTHNGLALMGTTLAVGALVLAARGDLRQSAEQQLLSWLMERQEQATVPAPIEAEPEAIQRVTAAHPQSLPEQQANVTFWLSKKYRVAPEPLTVLVAEAFEIGEKVRIDPTLILAVMAIESRFNPYAQSPVGAQGLMQVLTRVHTEKYEDFGGKLAAFDPLSNLRVGVMVLKDCIDKAGSIEGGLRFYVGAVTTDGSDYINKVLAEHQRLQFVAQGKPVPRYIAPARPIETRESSPVESGSEATDSAQVPADRVGPAVVQEVDASVRPAQEQDSIAAATLARS